MQQIILKINIFDDQKGERATIAAKTDKIIEEDAQPAVFTSAVLSASADSQRNTVYENAPGDEINSAQASGAQDKKQELVKLEKEIDKIKKGLK